MNHKNILSLILLLFASSLLKAQQSNQFHFSQAISIELAIQGNLFNYRVPASMGGKYLFSGDNEDENETSTIKDERDNKTYKTVKIGSQWWMAENMSYLPSVSPASDESYSDPLYYVYDYNGNSLNKALATSNYKAYGALYNWPAAMEACPNGWHLPSDSEWKQLEMFLGLSYRQADATSWRGTDEGGKLKSKSGWYNNDNANNESGFTALPGGYRYHDANFYVIGDSGIWWSDSETSSLRAWYRTMDYEVATIHRNITNKEDGFSIRCVKDN